MSNPIANPNKKAVVCAFVLKKTKVSKQRHTTIPTKTETTSSIWPKKASCYSCFISVRLAADLPKMSWSLWLNSFAKLQDDCPLPTELVCPARNAAAHWCEQRCAFDVVFDSPIPVRAQCQPSGQAEKIFCSSRSSGHLLALHVYVETNRVALVESS